MSAVRVFYSGKLERGEIIKVDAEELKHLRVRRIKPDCTVYILNGSGVEAEAVFMEGGYLKIVDVYDVGHRELPVRIVLFQSLIKSDAMEFVIKKAVELGVFRLIPVLSERSVVRINYNDKIKRWRKLVIESMKQCGRGFFMKIESPLKIYEINKFSFPVLLLWEKAEDMFRDVLMTLYNNNPSTIGLFIGPEGGFSEDEVLFLKSLGASPVRVAGAIMRSETASLFSIASVKFLFGR